MSKAPAGSRDSFARIIRTLVGCRHEAERMELGDLSRIIDMAVYQTALEWEGREPASPGHKSHLEDLLRLKLKLAYSEGEDNVVLLTRNAAGET